MKQKFFNQTGETAFRLWIFSLALEDLKKQPKNAEKLSNLLNKVSTFARGNWVKFNASEEEKEALKSIVAELEQLEKA